MKRLRRSSREGFALLLVLIVVSFAAAIAVLFLLSARQERASTDSYTQGSRVRQLADTAVNLVIGQINAATREGTVVSLNGKDTSGNTGKVISWASQPGMIRTYTTEGVLSRAYKLYSWNGAQTPGKATMIEPSLSVASFDPVTNAAEEMPPSTWFSQPSLFTDMNAPVTSTVGGVATNIYPIFDPSIFNTNTSPLAEATNNNPAGVKWDFPNELAYSTSGSNGYYASSTNTLPMPVQWMYVLQDGTWVFPTVYGGTNKVTFDASVVTATNPIVGRLAFWTDDETSKVNLNTAGEGAYWDWPKAATQDEMQLAGNPPARNEFYRFSGHPATTSLSAIFPEVMGNGAGFSRWNYSSYGPANTTYTTGLGVLLGQGTSGTGMSPRLGYGSGALTGSRGGTYPCPYYQIYDPLQTSTSSGQFSDGSFYQNYSVYSPVTLSNTYLYATPDDLWYSNATATPLRTGVNTGLNTYITQIGLQRRLSLITTNSRAPETTLFNTPRVSMWPITWPYPNSYFATDDTKQTVPNSRIALPATIPTPDSSLNKLTTLTATTYGSKYWITPQESLIAFCSTLNNQSQSAGSTAMPYYFQRQQSDSPTNDWLNIKRNRYLANYIRGMLAQPFPGLSPGSSTTLAGPDGGKWGSSTFGGNLGTGDWITLECMDYCRSMINQVVYDPNDANGNIQYSFTGQSTTNATTERNAYTATPLRIDASSLTSVPSSNFHPSPLSNGTSAGYSKAYVTQGSFPSLKEAAMMFVAAGRRMPVYMADIVGLSASPARTDPYAHIADPYYWRYLINPGPKFGGINDSLYTDSSGPLPGNYYIKPAGNGTPTAPYYSQPDGIPTGTGMSVQMETMNLYPVGAQTTMVQGHLILDFAQCRDGLNVQMYPAFWAKIDGLDQVTINGTAWSSNSVSSEIRPVAPQVTNTRLAGAFGTLKGKYNINNASATLTGNQANMTWTLASNPAKVSPDAVAFPFVGQQLTLSLYASYGQGQGHKVDDNPTGDANQFITSYLLPFNLYPTVVGAFGKKTPLNYGINDIRLPMPIAPRWTTRQAQSVFYPNMLARGGLATSPPGLTSPRNSGSPGTDYDYSWCGAEMAQTAAPVSSWGWTGSPPSFDSTDSDIRDAATFTYTAMTNGSTVTEPVDKADLIAGGPLDWMVYATGYNPGGVGAVAGGVISQPAISNTVPTNTMRPVDWIVPPVYTDTQTPWTNITAGYSMNILNRYAAMNGMPTDSTQTPTFIGGRLSGEATKGWTAAATDTYAPLFTDTSFVSGGGPVPSYAPQGLTLMTPYDTVISVLVSPTTAAQGDPRLTNNGGETTSFIDSYSLASPYNNASGGTQGSITGDPGSAAVYNNQWQSAAPTKVAIKPNTNASTIGMRVFPRPSFRAQWHEMANHGYVGMQTGFHLQPIWLTKSGYGSIPQAPRTSANNSLVLAMEGNNGGNGTNGQAQNLLNGIGAETNAYDVMVREWDWTSQAGSAADGGYVERADQDYQTFYLAGTYQNNMGTPYFSRFGISNQSQHQVGGSSNVTGFSPNRQVPSPVIFGTLPSSMTIGWQTLAFCPNPSRQVESFDHPGVSTLSLPTANSPPYQSALPDSALLDLFWMPVAEPYPISEEFSTAGKINLNYAMMPYPYIQRRTGLDAVLKSVWIYALPDGSVDNKPRAQDYKSWYYIGDSTLGGGDRNQSGGSGTHSRYPVNVDATLYPFDGKFAGGDIFRSASQICDMWLYPNDTKTANTPLVSGDSYATSTPPANIDNWWKNNGRLTSDNGREAPYNAIYSRITTQSNTYTVHWKVQALHKVTAVGIDPATWVEGFDKIASELRGSTLIERYLDPNAGSTAGLGTANIPDNSIPDYANPTVSSLASQTSPLPITYYYKWRIDNETYFQPPP